MGGSLHEEGLGLSSDIIIIIINIIIIVIFIYIFIEHFEIVIQITKCFQRQRMEQISHKIIRIK